MSFVLGASSHAETAGTVPVSVVLSAAQPGDVTVPFTLGGTAQDGSDFTIDPSPLVIPAGDTLADIDVTLLTDGLYEGPDEDLVLTLGTPTGAALGAVVQHTLTVEDEQAQPTVAFVAPSSGATEGGGPVLVTIELSGPQTVDVEVPFAAMGEADLGTDVTLGTSPAIILAGQTSVDVQVDPLMDGLYEGDEQLELSLGTPTGAPLGAPTVHVLTVTDVDPPPQVSFALPVQTVSEAGGSTTVDVQLSAPAGIDVTVPYTLAGSATPGVDAVVLPEPLVIPAGQVSGQLMVTLLDDDEQEGLERLRILLDGPNVSGAVLGTPSVHRVRIQDDELQVADPQPKALRAAPHDLEFPSLRAGEASPAQEVLVVNTDGVPITLTEARLVGLRPEQFTVSYPGGTLPVLMQPGDSLTLEVRFTPDAGGDHHARVVLRQLPEGDPTQSIRLHGLAVGPLGADVLVHAGDLPVTDGDDQTWAPLYGHYGRSQPGWDMTPVGNTLDDALYQAFLEGAQLHFAYDLEPGLYELNLGFSDPTATQPGQRRFDVLAEGALVLNDFDVLAEAGANHTAVQAPPVRVTVVDGTLDLTIQAVSGLALFQTLAVRAVPDLTADVASIAFGSVQQGQIGQQVVQLTNNGLKDATLSQVGFELLPGGGEAGDFSLEVDGVAYQGGVSSISHSVALSIPAGQSEDVTLTFAPSEHDDYQWELELLGDFDPIVLPVSGTGGADPGWGFLHPVLDQRPLLVVDYDGDGSEEVDLFGDESHTHEPGHVLVSHEWFLGGSPLATAVNTSAVLPLGDSVLSLTITDDNLTPAQATDDRVVTVYPIDGVPGTLISYYDGAPAGGAQNIVDSLPARATYIQRGAGTLQVANQSGFVGASPLRSQAVVVFEGLFEVPVADSYEFVLTGGGTKRLFVDGAPAVGPQALAVGTHTVEARFVVGSVASLPVSVQVLVGGQDQTSAFATALVHDEDGIVPVIHTMPTLGLDQGGNTIDIQGFGFYPADQVQVNWGGQVLTAVDFTDWTGDHIELVSPPGSGTIQVTVQTPAGISNAIDFEYSPSGPVPVNWTRLDGLFFGTPEPTCMCWGPDGKLYLGKISGEITVVTFDDNYSVTNAVTYPGVSGMVADDVLGIAISPFDVSGPVKVYVAHGEHFANGGGAFSGPSAYSGQISLLTGPNFDTPVPIVTGLPVSNHDHGINGMEFDHAGDLLVGVGGNTNAGVQWPLIGDLPESPLSAAIVKVPLSDPNFDGTVTYALSGSGAPSIDQVQGGNVDQSGGDVYPYAVGMRNTYDLVLATNGYWYATDNGPNNNYGPASTGPASNAGYPHPQTADELLLVEFDEYYGSPNRNRGRYDPRQNVYRDITEPDEPGVYRGPMIALDSSTNGISEYRARAFNGQLLGDLVVCKWNSNVEFVDLSANGRQALSRSPVNPQMRGLDVMTGPGGAILTADYTSNVVRVAIPNDVAAVGLTPYDIHPWRAPATGGASFVIGGSGFGNLGNTSVTIGGVPATLTSVSANRIRGIVPAHPSGGATGMQPVAVTVGPNTVTMTGAFQFLAATPGAAPGLWRTATPLPDALGEVAAARIGPKLYLVGEGTSKTYAYDLAGDTWIDTLAQRPFPGNHHAVEVIDGKLYLFGGLTSGFGKVQIYDPQLNSWTVGADMPWSGGSCSSALIDGKVYVCGGIVGNQTVANLSVYDPVLDQWDNGGGLSLPPMPTKVNHAASGTDGEKLYVFGGRQGPNVPQPGFDNVQVYDPVTNTWEDSDQPISDLEPMPRPRGGTGRAAWFDGRFYVFGGESDVAVFDDVQVYDPRRNLWFEDAEMVTPRHGVFPVTVGNRLFVIGGGTNAGFSASAVNEYLLRF